MVSDMSGEFIGTTPAPPAGDRIELTDLEVIQRWSLAVRGATAERSEVVAALRADLDWLEGSRRSARTEDRAPAPRSAPAAPARPTPRQAPKKVAKKVAKKTTKAAAKKAGRKSSTARGGSRRR